METMKNKFRSTHLQLAVLTLLSLQAQTQAQAQAQTAAAEPQAAVAPGQAASDANKADEKNNSKAITTLQTVTVTAQRRAEPLQTSSLSATVLSGDDLLKAGVNIVDQLQFVTPSTAANNFGQGVNITIRGVGKAETNTQTTTGVITYRDGVATFPGYLATEPYYDISSVQILRGPQGTFGGQNATGGAVFVDSNDPVINGGTTGYATAQFGNYKDYGFQGAVNLPVNSTFAMRVAVNHESRDSFYTITGPWTGNDGDIKMNSARVSALWKPNAALTVSFKTDYNHIDLGAYPADPVIDLNNPTRLNPSDPFHITADAPMKALDYFARQVLKVDYTFDNGMKFRSVSGHQHGSSTYKADLDGAIYSPTTNPKNWTFRDVANETIYSQEFNLISPDSGALTWLVGAYAQNDTHYFPVGEFVTGVPEGSIYSEYRLSGTNPITTRALFGQIGYLLTDDLKLIVEGRHSKNTTSNDVTVSQYGTPLLAQQSAEFTNFSGKVALNWTLNERHFLYAFAASAFRPGGLNVPVGIGIPAPFKEEKVRTVEVGWKATWLDGHVQTQTSAFYNVYKNFQVTIGYPQYPTFGFEQQLQANLGDGWQARANLGWLHSKIGKFFATDPRAATVSPCDINTGPGSASCINLTGHEQTYAPELTFNVGLERRFVMGDTTITPRINYAHISSQWATLFENRARGDELGARNLLNAQIDWERGDWTGSLYGTNLTDKRYLAAIGSGLRYAGAPRQYGVRITKFF